MSAMLLGIVQSFLILRILSVGEWGLVQLVVSVGSALGIYQHLGLASASNREIAAAQKKKDVFKIFITTVSVRYLVTTPIAVGLFVFAPRISAAYEFMEILLPLRIFAVIIFLQGSQAIFNAVISGTKRFKELFIFQVVVALVSLLLYVPLVYQYKILGFFYAGLIHETLKTVSYGIIALKPYYKKLRFPTKNEFTQIFKELFSLGMSIYIVKILVINWERSGTNLLGFIGNIEWLGIYSFALLYAKKLMHVSDAITDVSLPVFSEKFVHNIKEFRDIFAENFNRVFVTIVFFAMSAIYWAKELIQVLIGSSKYNEAIPLLLPMVFSFIFVSLINILKSSLAIPAKKVKDMILGFLLMFIVTVGFYFITRKFYNPVYTMSYSMLLGSFLGFAYMVRLLQSRLQIRFISYAHVLLMVQALVVSHMGSISNIYVKFPAYFIFVGLYLWSVHIAGFIRKEELFSFVQKVTGFIKGSKR